jgi:carbon starvation protein
MLLVGYGFAASVLPVWLLLSPRDYLSSIMKIAVIGMLAVGVIIVAPTMHMPAFTQFIHGGGPIIPGILFPYLFITIACGAISGFHALVSSGTTPKMIMKESHIKSIAAGSMLVEAMVSILALIAASSLLPLDYFAINVPAEKFAAILPKLHAMGFVDSNLTQLSAEVGEKIAGRTGGAVSLGVGMAQIFSKIPGLNGLMSYWYHFAIMFEALFILTTIDAGTRIGRFVLQEMLGKVFAASVEFVAIVSVAYLNCFLRLSYGNSRGWFGLIYKLKQVCIGWGNSGRKAHPFYSSIGPIRQRPTLNRNFGCI